MSDAPVPPHHVDWEPQPEFESHAHAELPPGEDERVRAPWRHVLMLGVAAFALWFLLYAPTLQHNAQVSPVGTRRTVSLDVTGPVAAVSRALQLSHIVSITGRGSGLSDGGSPGGLTVAGPHPASPATGGSRRKSGTTPKQGGTAPTTTTTVPPNPKDPTGAHPLRVLIVGDSIGIDLGDALQPDLAQTGVVSAALDGRVSTGLTRPDYFNWPAELTADLKSQDPQVVVIMIGANDAQDFLGPPDVPYTSPEWNTLYAQRVAQFMQIAQSGGATVVWVGMPPMQSPGLNAQMSDVNAVVQQQAAKTNPPVTYLSTDRSLGTAQGGYTAFVTNGAGQVVNVRTPDGTHLTPGGGQVAAQQVIGELQTLGYKIP
jgi:lysophospholipase L1-like esterase